MATSKITIPVNVNIEDVENLIDELKNLKPYKLDERILVDFNSVVDIFVNHLKYTQQHPKVKRTERGWAGHFIAASYCRFRRNTLLEYGDKKWIVSTVGAMYARDKGNPEMIGANRWYETMVFVGKEDSGYIDIDVTKPIETENDCGIWGKTWDEVLEKHPTPDNAANDIHERIVDEMIVKIQM